ncbi:MAG: hypothetical protein WB902_05670, partial [Acetobacteraceae bacterium]
MAFLASGHTALETVGQIGLIDSAKGNDNLLLNDVSQFHFALSCHARIYAARKPEPDFFWEMQMVELAMAARNRSGAFRQSVVG